MRWFVVVAAVVAGLLQAAVAGWWGSTPLFSLPIIIVALQLPSGDRRQLFVVALAAGLGWDAVTGAVGAGTLATLAAAAVGVFVAQRWLPPHGGTAVAALGGGMALVSRLVLFIISGFSAVGVLAALGEAIGTGLVVAAFYRLTYRK